ncbi:unnamed protein product [Colias eurytheme]|nr:unnamed protein product [Colias eurytheme]
MSTIVLLIVADNSTSEDSTEEVGWNDRSSKKSSTYQVKPYSAPVEDFPAPILPTADEIIKELETIVPATQQNSPSEMEFLHEEIPEPLATPPDDD